MITALFFVYYIAYVVCLSIFVTIPYLIPVWIVSGYFIALLLVVLTVYANYPWMKRTSALNPMKHRMAHGIVFLVNHFFIRLKIEVEGKENVPKDGRLTVYANHKSLLDPLVIFDVVDRPLSFTPKSEVISWPFLGKFL